MAAVNRSSELDSLSPAARARVVARVLAAEAVIDERRAALAAARDRLARAEERAHELSSLHVRLGAAVLAARVSHPLRATEVAAP